MTPATLGELLYLGTRYLQAAAAGWDEQAAAAPDAGARQLHRLVVVMTRYVDDVAPCDEVEALSRADLTLWQRAAVDVAAALRMAGVTLAGVTGEGGLPDVTAGLPLADAATALLAGRDLLHTHHVFDQDGIRDGRSEWADVITSAAVRRTITDLAARWAVDLAPLAELLPGNLAGPGPGGPAGAGREFTEAGRWLRNAAAATHAAQRADPVSAGDRTLLFAIPAASVSFRDPPVPGETAAELCRGITLSAARLQASVRGAADRAAWSPVTTAGAWRWTATAGAVTSHLSELILRSVADRAGQLGLPGGGEIRAAGAAMAAARAGWQRLAAEWGGMTTETRFLASTTVIEASDLVLRLGRMARDDPAWTPQAGRDVPLRDPAGVAPDAGAAAAAVAAVHHSACAFERVAAGDLGAVRAAARAGRLHVPTRTMPPKVDVPRPYAPAPDWQLEPLIDAYRAAIELSGMAARVLDRAAIATGGPSQFMALARSAYTAAPGPGPGGRAPDAGGPGRPGPVERALRSLGVTDPVMQLRAAAIDTAGSELIAEASGLPAGPGRRSRRDPGPVERRVRSLGVTDRKTLLRAAALDTAGAKLIAEASWPAAGQARRGPRAPGTPGPVEYAVRSLGVTDSVMLLRAAAVDTAGAELIAEASSPDPGLQGGGTGADRSPAPRGVTALAFPAPPAVRGPPRPAVRHRARAGPSPGRGSRPGRAG